MGLILWKKLEFGFWPAVLKQLRYIMWILFWCAHAGNIILDGCRWLGSMIQSCCMGCCSHKVSAQSGHHGETVSRWGKCSHFISSGINIHSTQSKKNLKHPNAQSTQVWEDVEQKILKIIIIWSVYEKRSILYWQRKHKLIHMRFHPNLLKTANI